MVSESCRVVDMTKTCSRCRQDKPLDEYHRATRGRLGRQATCKECTRKATRDRRERLSQVSVPAEKHCPGCDQTLPADAFNRWSYGKDGLSLRCRQCRRAERVEQEYGVTHESIMAMFEAQGRKCAICEIPVVWQVSNIQQADSACIDHCHAEGHVRGILCTQCNRAIGLMRDDPKTLVAAARYLGGVDAERW